jgi:hypothetical protein
MATLLKVLDNLADIKSAGGVALGLGTQALSKLSVRRSDVERRISGYCPMKKEIAMTDSEGLFTVCIWIARNKVRFGSLHIWRETSVKLFTRCAEPRTPRKEFGWT